MLSISVGATINISATTVGADASRAVINISGNNHVITFSGSVNGISALQMVANIETISYGGQGVAVCSINGIGNPAIPGQCLGESSGRYWSYWRAALGANGFYYSGGGAGGTTVTNATVEGWSFGSSGPPPFASFCAVAGCAPTPPPTAAPTTVPSPPTTTSVETNTNAEPKSKDKNANGKSAKNSDAKTDAQPSASIGDRRSENASGGRTVKPGSRPDTQSKTTRAEDTGSPLGIGVAAGALIIAGVAGLFIKRRRTAKGG